jgi:hypothetical protein
MKKLATLLLAVTFATVIVLPVASHINHSSSKGVQTADEFGPVPPVPPKAA